MLCDCDTLAEYAQTCIQKLSAENRQLKEENKRLREELANLQYRYDLVTIPPGCEKGKKGGLV